MTVESPCFSYGEYVNDFINGEIEDLDVDEMREKIQTAYDMGTIASSHYDELMGYIQDLEE